MPAKLEQIIQRMIDAGESEENIASVIQEYKKTTTPQQDTTRRLSGPDTQKNVPNTFTQGVLNSIGSGEALKAGLEGGLGWLHGATLDIPSTLMNLFNPENIKSAVARQSGLEPNNGKNPFSGMYDTAKGVVTGDIPLDPYNFGRGTGQITGQPLVTAGVAKYGPKVVSNTKLGLSRPIERIGGIIESKQPMTGSVPFGKFIVPRTMRNIEEYFGGRLRGIGQMMRPVDPYIGQSTGPVNLTQPTMNVSSDNLYNLFRRPEDELPDLSQLPRGVNVKPIPDIQVNPSSDPLYNLFRSGEEPSYYGPQQPVNPAIASEINPPGMSWEDIRRVFKEEPKMPKPPKKK